ncbi:Protein YeeZ [Candidatus Erwinia haradaeae]|uniref:Protein YeeZ n=1 Tax=Candidatus Erwinia haradaeae TaxID=1922217 RepID=A0A451DDS0_9GAMM|nr:NAD-dependent epimerase/dehydratase family protein [Candidatus Erwinia haradaeae]VFP84548.1 Protein YeeZ [Candidatus Erwinia haradaeae]
MKRVAIVGLGWIGMPLGISLIAAGWRVSGSKTTQNGVDAVRMYGIDGYCLQLKPILSCKERNLPALFSVDAMVIILPVTRMLLSSTRKDKDYLLSIQNLVKSARDFGVSHIVFTSSISVYGTRSEIVNENTGLSPKSVAGNILREVENWLCQTTGIVVDILRLSGLVGPNRHPGYFLAGKKELENGSHGVNLVHRDDVIAAIILLLKDGIGGRIYNLSASKHPARNEFYPYASMQLGLKPPTFTTPSRGRHGKIIDGSKICRELGLVYLYSDPVCMLRSSSYII